MTASVSVAEMEILKLEFCDFSVPVSVVVQPAQSFSLHAVRFASKKTGGSSKNLGGKSPGRRYGFKKQDGSECPISPVLLFFPNSC